MVSECPIRIRPAPLEIVREPELIPKRRASFDAPRLCDFDVLNADRGSDDFVVAFERKEQRPSSSATTTSPSVTRKSFICASPNVGSARGSRRIGPLAMAPRLKTGIRSSRNSRESRCRPQTTIPFKIGRAHV